MNPTRDFVRTALPALPASRTFPALPRVAAATLTRAGFPVVSNRAFIGAWTTRRGKLVAAAQVARSN